MSSDPVYSGDESATNLQAADLFPFLGRFTLDDGALPSFALPGFCYIQDNKYPDKISFMQRRG